MTNAAAITSRGRTGQVSGTSIASAGKIVTLVSGAIRVLCEYTANARTYLFSADTRLYLFVAVVRGYIFSALRRCEQ